MLTIESLASEHSNKFCADCTLFKPGEESNKVTSVSVNNGVFLCADCARMHLSVLKPEISMIRPIELDNWTVEQLGLIEAGGNDKFAKFISSYDFLAYIEKEALLKDGNTHQEIVYGSMAGKYWREKLHVIRNCLPFDKEPPNREEGLQSLDKVFEDGWLVIEKKKTEKQIQKEKLLNQPV